MSGEQIRLQAPPKLFGVNSWIAQMIRQWIPYCLSGDRKCTGLKSAAANLQNWQLMTSGRSALRSLPVSGDGNPLVDITSQQKKEELRQERSLAMCQYVAGSIGTW